jgi:hypothetical protein
MKVRDLPLEPVLATTPDEPLSDAATSSRASSSMRIAGGCTIEL